MATLADPLAPSIARLPANDCATPDPVPDLVSVQPSDASARSLRDPVVLAQRRAMLTLPHAAPLAAYAARLRAAGPGMPAPGRQVPDFQVPGFQVPGFQVPDFDPLDGGTAARVLFVLEKPGPGIVPGGFVSRDNDTPTAQAIHAFMQQAGLPRAETVLWNLVPWWNGTTAITAAERLAGAQALRDLLPLLPRLDTAVLVGRTAAAAWPMLDGLRVLSSAHPSPQVRAGFRDRWDAIPEVWRQARR